jgi:cytosine/adenosine deaminase-related metal-dependent hydrolase
MKKFLAAAVILAMVSGCTTMQSIGSWLQNVVSSGQQILCNPTDAQKATANSIIQFLSAGTVVITSLVVNGVTVTPTQAEAAFQAVLAGVCVGATDLTNALNWYEALTSSSSNKAMLKVKAITAPNDGSLWQFVDKQ